MPKRRAHRIWRDNALSICLFAFFMLGQILTGHAHYNNEQASHGEARVALPTYLASGSFREVTAENWESEFLQMAAYVLLTIALFQRGSSESKDPDKRAKVDRDPRKVAHSRSTPWPVRRGGLQQRADRACRPDAHRHRLYGQLRVLVRVAIVVFSIFLRQRGSPESKRVDAPHHETGSD